MTQLKIEVMLVFLGLKTLGPHQVLTVENTFLLTASCNPLVRHISELQVSNLWELGSSKYKTRTCS